MAIFLSTYVNKIDRKGRVSVPAEFRKVLQSQTYQGVVVFPSLQHPALEACSAEHMEQLSESLESLDLPSDELDVIEATIFGGSAQLPWDNEGRVILPRSMCEFAGVSEEAAFVGRRKTFQIWEPKALAEYESRSREKARNKDISLSKILSKASALRTSEGGGK
ncbi:Transcriptional regulator MraZ [Azospirillaceae bacterium]